MQVAGQSATSAVTVTVTCCTCQSMAYVLDICSNSFLTGFLLDGLPCIENEVCSILEACSDPLCGDVKGVTFVGPIKIGWRSSLFSGKYFSLLVSLTLYCLLTCHNLWLISSCYSSQRFTAPFCLYNLVCVCSIT